MATIHQQLTYFPFLDFLLTYTEGGDFQLPSKRFNTSWLIHALHQWGVTFECEEAGVIKMSRPIGQARIVKYIKMLENSVWWQSFKDKPNFLRAPLEVPEFLHREWDADVLPVELANRLIDDVGKSICTIHTAMLFYYCAGFTTQELGKIFDFSIINIEDMILTGLIRFKEYPPGRLWWYNVNLNIIPVKTSVISMMEGMKARHMGIKNWSDLSVDKFNSTFFDYDKPISRERALQMRNEGCRFIEGPMYIGWPLIGG